MRFRPDGQVAFTFERAAIAGNGLTAGGQSWEITTPWRTNRVRFRGPDGAPRGSVGADGSTPSVHREPGDAADIDLVCTTEGLGATMGQDQDQHHLILLPGQADFHYQHMTHVVGTIRLGDDVHEVDGRGGKDHSWGPRTGTPRST